MKKYKSSWKKIRCAAFVLSFVLSISACAASASLTETPLEELVPQQEEDLNLESMNQENMNQEDMNLQNMGQENVITSEELNEEAEAVLPTLHVEGARLVDSAGNSVQLKGVSTHGLAWFPQYVNQEFFLELKDDWSADVVRLALYTEEYGGYCSGGDREALKNLVKDGARYATEAGLYVIIDWHVLSDANPHNHKEDAKAFFEEMSAEFADQNNVFYELCNEPNGGTSWAEIKSYAEELIPIIRANDEDAIIIVGTPTWSQDVNQAAADPITEYDNIMYSLHFYATTHTDWLRDRMKAAYDAGLPMMVTEFGTCESSGSGAMDYAQCDAWIQAMDECGISYVAWNLSNKAETSAIFKPECTKTSGFSAEDLSENGTWIYEMLHR